MRDVRVQIPDPLADDGVAAAAAAGQPELTLPAVIRFALARLAGWPESAANAIARPRQSGSDGAAR